MLCLHSDPRVPYYWTSDCSPLVCSWNFTNMQFLVPNTVKCQEKNCTVFCFSGDATRMQGKRWTNRMNNDPQQSICESNKVPVRMTKRKEKVGNIQRKRKLKKCNQLARHIIKIKPKRREKIDSYEGIKNKTKKKPKQNLCKKEKQRNQTAVKNSKQIPILPSSISIGSGLAGLVSGFGSISPGLSFRGSSAVSSSLSLWAALSLKIHCMHGTMGFVLLQVHNNHPFLKPPHKRIKAVSLYHVSYITLII